MRLRLTHPLALRVDQDRPVEVGQEVELGAGALDRVGRQLGGDLGPAQPEGGVGAGAGRLDEVDQ